MARELCLSHFTHSGIILAMTVVAEEGAKPSPRPTKTRVAHSASRLILAAGGAISVPSDHSATPTISTRAPPILPRTHMPCSASGEGWRRYLG